jgi:hypothetical protein
MTLLFRFNCSVSDSEIGPDVTGVMMFMSQSSSKFSPTRGMFVAKMVTPGRPDAVTREAPDSSSADRISGSAANNDMESCLYTWTPAQAAGRSVRQKIESFGRRLFRRRRFR